MCPKMEVKRVLKINDGKNKTIDYEKSCVLVFSDHTLQYIHETAECAELVLFKNVWGSLFILTLLLIKSGSKYKDHGFDSQGMHGLVKCKL